MGLKYQEWSFLHTYIRYNVLIFNKPITNHVLLWNSILLSNTPCLRVKWKNICSIQILTLNFHMHDILFQIRCIWFFCTKMSKYENDMNQRYPCLLQCGEVKKKSSYLNLKRIYIPGTNLIMLKHPVHPCWSFDKKLNTFQRRNYCQQRTDSTGPDW